jgi:hypothetical protein
MMQVLGLFELLNLFGDLKLQSLMLKEHFCTENRLKKSTGTFLKARMRIKTIVFN